MRDFAPSILGLSLTLSLTACGGKSDDVGSGRPNGGYAGTIANSIGGTNLASTSAQGGSAQPGRGGAGAASSGGSTGGSAQPGRGGAGAASSGGSTGGSAQSARGGAGAASSGGSTGGSAQSGRGGTGTTSNGGSTASGGATVATSCVVHADCVLASVTCCGTCGAPTKNDVVAIASDAFAAYRAKACGTGPVMCPACATMNNPELFATCDAGVCKVVDLTESPLTSCAVAGDCALRSTSCCPPCGTVTDLWSLVSIRSGVESEFRPLVCDAGQVCGKCLSSYPTNATISCSDSHCAIDRM